MDEHDLRLDGNAVAGMLGMIFAVEPTTSLVECASCGTSNQLGALEAYVHGMGAVLRCPNCQEPVLRASHAPDRMWLDLRGTRWLQVEMS
jgi:endogenous inhibitor of DNA gyrase (YacG/DUF329 family)